MLIFTWSQSFTTLLITSSGSTTINLCFFYYANRNDLHQSKLDMHNIRFIHIIYNLYLLTKLKSSFVQYCITNFALKYLPFSFLPTPSITKGDNDRPPFTITIIVIIFYCLLSVNHWPFMDMSRVLATLIDAIPSMLCLAGIILG